MSDKPYLHNIDLDGNEIKNVVINSLVTDPATPKEGQFWYNSIQKRTKYYDGSLVRAHAKVEDLNAFGAFVGGHDASGGLLPTTGSGLDPATGLPDGSIQGGDYWRITVAGTIVGIGGGSDVMDVGDVIIAVVDNATVAGDFIAVQTNIDLVGNIYTTDGTAPDRTITITNQMTFLTPLVSDKFAIGVTPFVAEAGFHYKSNSTDGVILDGNSQLVTDSILKLRDNTGTTLGQFRNDGSAWICQNNQVLTVGSQFNYLIRRNGETRNVSAVGGTGANYVGLSAENNGLGNNIFVSLRAEKFSHTRIDSSHYFVIATGWNGGRSSSGTEAMRVDATQNVGIGFGGNTGTNRLTIRASGNTANESIVRHMAFDATVKFVRNAEGQTAMINGIGVTAVINASFGHIWRAQDKPFGFGFYPNNTTSAGVTIQTNGTTDTGLSIFFQTAPSGIVKGINSVASNSSPTGNYAVYGGAREASITNIGIYGEILTGTIVPSLYSSAIVGISKTISGGDMRGGYFASIPLVGSSVYSNSTFTGVLAVSNASTIGNSTNVRSIAGEFRATGGNSTISILIPSTGNTGIMVVGADDVSGNGSIVEITGDIEIMNGTFGLINKARNTGTRVRAYINESPAGVFNWVLESV